MGEIMAGFMDSSVFKDPLFGSPSNSVSESLTPVNTPARAFNKSPAPTGYMSAEKAKKASPVAQTISSPGLVTRVELENAETLAKRLNQQLGSEAGTARAAERSRAADETKPDHRF